MRLNYNKNRLNVEDVDVLKVAEKVKTPFFIYSAAEFKKNYFEVQDSLKAIDHIICYSAKSNSNGAVIKLLGSLGCGADIVSGGELYRVLKAGIKPGKIVFSGVGKTDEEIEYALKAGILMFNVESLGELRAINSVARRLKRKAPVAIRINPDIEVDTHHHITTGKAENKFGINFPHVIESYIEALRLPNIKVIGIQMHLGSQIKETRPYIKGIKKLFDLINCISLLGADIKFIDIGGGFGIAYMENEKFFSVKELARELRPLLKNKGVKLIVEPGRFISGPSGLLVTKVLYNKYAQHKNFVIVDAGMNDFIRPSLYSAYHAITPVLRVRGRRSITADIVGPICESGDYFAKGRRIPECMPGEFIAINDAGAYGFTMSSTYNSRPRAAEVMASGRKYKIVRERETYKHLTEGERDL